jgi:hypothetical protein
MSSTSGSSLSEPGLSSGPGPSSDPGIVVPCPGPRSSGDRAPPSGGGSAGSNPAGGADKDPVDECVLCGADEVPAALNFRRRPKLPSPLLRPPLGRSRTTPVQVCPRTPLPSEGRRADKGPTEPVPRCPRCPTGRPTPQPGRMSSWAKFRVMTAPAARERRTELVGRVPDLTRLARPDRGGAGSRADQ